jgi:putative ABC transport system substrate-binding protein
VRHPAEIEPVLSTMANERTVVLLAPSSFLFTHRRQIAELAAKRRFPVAGWVRPWAESGILMSYGASNAEILRRAASHVARILNGAKPADLPVEQPTKFELVVNMKTAKALGLTIPPSLLLRADEVIE